MLCMRLSVYCTNKQTFHTMGRHSFIILVFNQCAVHIILRPKKKLLINFKTTFSKIVVGKKLLIKTEKVNYSLQVEKR